MQIKKILPLSKKIIAKIAAGEVIERPVYAVKELVENSLDANADSITISLEDAGLKKIIVIDNGEGMNTEDLKESFKLHTTSKIISEEQLDHIDTFGFRGEALASMTAVSNITIQSRPKEQTAGTKIELINGVVKNVSPVGMPIGTNITVANLFHSVPARKKFLKSLRTEFRHSVELLTRIALANPQVHFLLKHNNKIIFDLPKTSDIRERIKVLLGTNLVSNLLPISYRENYISISGFIAKPQIATKTTTKQFIFVNQRNISDKLMNHSVKNAYGNLLDTKTQPTFILNITIPYEFVDVNVHPRKEFVRFIDTNVLLETIYRSVTNTLDENNLTFYDEQPFGIALADNPRIVKSFAGKLLKENQVPWDLRPKNEIGTFQEIVQLHNLYLLTQTRFGLLLVDQHAAHERILYEQFLKAFTKQKNDSAQYHLPKPVFFELSLSESEVLKEYLSFFEQLGFTIELFKDTTFIITSVPLIFQDRNAQELITEILNDLTEDKKPRNIDDNSKKLLSYLACRGSIKAGESLTKKQAKELLEKLEQTDNNATCPHGRPTKILIDINQLHKMFKRK